MEQNKKQNNNNKLIRRQEPCFFGEGFFVLSFFFSNMFLFLSSRLACQIVVTAQMDGFTCSIPQMEGSQSADMG